MTGTNRVTGGGALTPDRRADAEAILAASAHELADVRKAAERWQVGLAGLATGIGAYAVLRGGEQIDKIASPWNAVAGIGIAFAFAGVLIAGILAIRAAYGLPKLRSTVDLERSVDDHRAAVQSARLLRAAMWVTVVSVVTIFASMTVTWFAPKGQPLTIQVTTENGERVCGEVIGVRGDDLVVKSDSGERSIRLDTLTALAPDTGCS